MSRQEDFINTIAPYVQKWQQAFGFGVCSAIIAQACLESAYGTSDKAQNGHNNYHGLKYKPNRVTCSDGVFDAPSAEQNPDGSYTPIVCKWFSFENMDKGVQGYFQFILSGPYKVEGITDPQAYLQALKDASYATSKNYVQNNMKVIETYNLTRFDGGAVMVPDSSLVKGVIPSPNYTAQRKYKIDTIIIHCMAGTYDAVACGNAFAKKSRQASSHYGISSNGDIYQYVPESARAWTTGGDKKCNGWTGSDYDHRSITMEVSNTTLAPYWGISNEALQAIVALCTDICRRHNITPMWSNDPKLVGHADKQSFALHRWFASKACPGDTIIACMPYIALTVGQNLNAGGYILNGYDYSPVFDPVYYANKYPDLMAAFGLNKDALWLHFQQYGMNEFRQASEQFNPQVYYDRYEDLRNAFKDDRPMYYFHYVAFGKAEGRSAV